MSGDLPQQCRCFQLSSVTNERNITVSTTQKLPSNTAVSNICLQVLRHKFPANSDVIGFTWQRANPSVQLQL